jgi:hypothetical protein
LELVIQAMQHTHGMIIGDLDYLLYHVCKFVTVAVAVYMVLELAKISYLRNAIPTTPSNMPLQAWRQMC